jgi:hypothetical protein
MYLGSSSANFYHIVSPLAVIIFYLKKKDKLLKNGLWQSYLQVF